VIAYCELIYASEALAVERDGEALARRQLAITKDVVRAGLQPPSAVKRAELEVALREEAVLRQQLGIGDLSLALRRLAGLELDGPPLVPGDPLELPATELDETSVVRAARAHGPSIAQLRLAQQVADIDVELAGNARLPRLDLVVAGSVGGVGPSLSDAFGNAGEAQTYAVMAGLVLRWDLGGAASATAEATRVRRARLDAERSDAARALAATAISATRQLGAAKRRSELTDTAVQVADEALQAELVAFQAGRSTNVAVFQRRDEVAEARLRRARARADAAEALTVVDYLTGKLLERHGLELAESRPS
jgi:outer membrane protein TolC